MDIKSPLRKIKRKLKSYTRAEKLKSIIADLLPEIACIDVGASYYAHPQWEIFRSSAKTLWIAVEPNHNNLGYLKNWKYPAKPLAIEVGLSQKGGQQKLYKTNVDSGSSLYPPLIPLGEEFRYDYNYFFPIQEIMIQTITLEEVVQQHASNLPFSVKLDTQGTELSILQGLPRTKLENDLLCVDIEVSLKARPVMQGSAHFYEVQKYLEDLGLELVFLKPIPTVTEPASLPLNGIGIINECDAIFLLRRDIADKRGPSAQRLLLGFYICYQLYDEARHLVTELKKNQTLSEGTKTQLTQLEKLLA